MAKKTTTKPEKIEKRAPVIAIMGHVDHGKSSILDYIRKTNVIDGEAGGITQHVSAYEVEHGDSKITFLDTPGHEAFAATRSRGASIADLAILVVSAEDGVKEQTLGALEFIKESNIPFIVAINKIDSPKADVNTTKYSLVEHEIYLEGMGGDISFVEISAKTGENIDDLLDTILLAADVEDLKGDVNKKAVGYVLESEVDPKKGVSATLIIKDGSLSTGDFVISGESTSPVRIMEDFAGKQIKEASFSSPIRIVGFDSLPTAGESFFVMDNKKEVQKYLKDLKDGAEVETPAPFVRPDPNLKHIPLVIKADVMGSIEAIKHQIEKIEKDFMEAKGDTRKKVTFKIIETGVGDISEADAKSAGADADAIIVGFNAKITKQAADIAETFGLRIENFDIIYKLTEFLEEILEERKPREMVDKVTGELKVIRVFSWTNKGGVVGGKVKEGEIKKTDKLKIFRRNEEIGTATIKELQKGKQDTDKVLTEEECGMMVVSKYEITEGDRLKAVNSVEE